MNHFSLSGQASACKAGGGREGEEHHVHVRQPQEMDSDVHLLEGQVEGELERGRRNADEHHYVINVVDGSASGTASGPRSLNARSEAWLRHDDAAQG